MTPTTICFINQKGGCGKSSTCFHVGGSLADAGYRVLLVDADPQGSLSKGFFGRNVVENLAADQTIAAVFDGVPAESIVLRTTFDGLSLLAANQTLTPHNLPCPEHSGLRQFALAEELSHATDFDFVLIDCPPTLYLCSWNAMLAADYVVIPVPPEDFATQGLSAVHQAIDNARLLNSKLQLLGHLITRSDRRLLIHQAYERKLREIYGESVLDTVIPEASAFKVALSSRRPVGYFDPQSKAANLTLSLTNEILRRTGNAAPTRHVA